MDGRFNLVVEILIGDAKYPVNQIDELSFRAIKENARAEVYGYPSVFAFVQGEIRFWPVPDRDNTYDLYLREVK
jgi:hypothetical protein